MTAETASETPRALLQAFAQTDYLVRLDAGDVIVRVGRGHDQLDQALGGRRWAIITAFNPGAERDDDASNDRRHNRLRRHVERAGLETLPSLNHDPGGHWPDEPGLLIVGLNSDERARMAQRFGQAAVLCGSGGEIARLELHGADWPDSLPAWAVRGR